MTKKSDSFIVTVDDTGEYNVVDRLELDKYAMKAQVDYDGSKQVIDEQFKAGVHVLEPKYNPYDLVALLDLYTYHAACVDAVAVDCSGIDYTLKPVEDVEPVEAEKTRFTEVLENCKPSINHNLQKMVFDRRAIGYGALEVIRDSTSDSDVTKLKHIPAQTLRRHTDTKRVVHVTPAGKRVWYVIYGKNYDDNGNPCDIHADTGAFHPYNSLAPHERANELLWTMEYAPGTDYYGRPPIISALGSISSDISAVKYNNAFFQNYGMPKFAITVTGDFADYDVDPDDPDYDVTQTLKYRISQQIKEVIRNPHSAICITIPSEGEEGNVDLNITPLSVQTEEGHFRMLRKDTRDEVLHAHHVDPSRLGIYDAGSLNGGNSDNTMASYKYGTIAPIKAEIEDLVNLIGVELEVTSWKFCIEDVTPIDYTKDLALAEFLFARAAMTPRELIDNFGGKFGLTAPEDNKFLDEYYLNNVPLEAVWNQSENNPMADIDSIMAEFEDGLRGETDGNDRIGSEETDTRIADSDEAKIEQ